MTVSTREKTPDPHIVRYPNGTYYLRARVATPSGSRRQIEAPLNTSSFRDAVRMKSKVLAQYEQVATKTRIKDLLPEYLRDRKGDVKHNIIRESTFNETTAMWRGNLLPEFGYLPLERINEKAWIAYVRKKKGMNLTNHRKIFSHFLKWCRYGGYISSEPELKIPHFESRRRLVLRPDEIAGLLTYAPDISHRLSLFIRFYLLMGMRRSEIIKLRWEQIDLKRGVLTLEAAHTKTKRHREIPINRHILSELRVIDRSKAWVFPNHRNRGVRPHMSESGFKRSWAELLNRASIERPLTFHDLRATFESYAHKRSDFTPTQLEKFAGAAIDVQRQVYVSMTAEDLKGLEDVVSFEGLDEILNRPTMKKLRGKLRGRGKDAPLKNSK